MLTFAPTLRARLTLWYTLVLAVPLIAFAIGANVMLHRILLHRVDVFLGNGVSAFASELEGEARENAVTQDAVTKAFHQVRFPDLRILLFSDSLALAGSSILATIRDHPAIPDSSRVRILRRETLSGAPSLNLDYLLATLRATPPEQRGSLVFDDEPEDYRFITREVRLNDRAFVLVGAYPLDGVHNIGGQVRTASVIAVPFLLLAAALGGLLLASRGLAPLTAIAQRASQIGEANLDQRLPVANARDELGTLAVAFNALLARLERSFAEQRRFMADASHELRTPIAILQSEVDVTLAREQRTNEEYRASVLVMREAAQRLGRIVNDVFMMSRADAGHLAVRRDLLDMGAVVMHTAASARQLAAERGVRIEARVPTSSPVEGDADLLGRLVLNLVDNAVRHSRRDGRVDLSLRPLTDGYELCVTDQGEGIPAEAQPHVFERFFRADSARSRGEPTATSGAGLGLAISRWIAEAHGGSLDLVRSAPGETVFRAVIPAARDETSA